MPLSPLLHDEVMRHGGVFACSTRSRTRVSEHIGSTGWAALDTNPRLTVSALGGECFGAVFGIRRHDLSVG